MPDIERKLIVATRSLQQFFVAFLHLFWYYVCGLLVLVMVYGIWFAARALSHLRHSQPPIRAVCASLQASRAPRTDAPPGESWKRERGGDGLPGAQAAGGCGHG
ncbi:MAG: hypothetical protein U9N09_10015 [Euryarchaeota archaeon]|nr:hypothetical protein [Euryarchaeota archaeon]